MNSPDIEETTERFVCPRCQAFSHHVRSPLKMDVRQNTYTAPRPLNDEPGWYEVRGTTAHLELSEPKVQWTATLCASCNTPSVWRGATLVFPRETDAVPPPHPDMPANASELYNEARLVLPDSRRAAAALARAALESFLKTTDTAGTRKNLQTRIGDLRGKVNEPLWRVLTALRVVGNDSLHDGSDEIVQMYLSGEPSEIVEPLFGALNALVEELVTQPRRAEELYQMISQPKREAAERSASFEP